MKLLHELKKGLLLLSRFSRVQLCVTPWTAAHQASLSLGFSRQEHWSGFAISFSNAWKCKVKVKVKSLSRVWLLATPWTAAYQAPPSMGFSRQQYWSGVPLAFSQRMDRWKLKLLINSYQQIKSEKTKYGYMLKICSVASFMKSLNSI